MSLDIKKNLFDGLGKATLRGVRRCPKCGTYNGTRGVSCKNEKCDVVFRETSKAKKINNEAVKVITGLSENLYSVRVRDRGPDYRGFVRLPYIRELETPSASEDVVNSSSLDNPVFIAQTSGSSQCMICRKSDLTLETCWHIKAANESFLEAEPLHLRNSVLNNLSISKEMKQAIWLLATETTGPFVQRVSKNVMVVKCKPAAKNSAGFLHFSFLDNGKKQCGGEPKFHCSCKAFKSGSKQLVLLDGEDNSINLKQCVHFYACICAFASDNNLKEEFKAYINLSFNPEIVEISPDQRFFALYQSDTDKGDIKLQIVPTADKVTLLSGESCDIISSITDDTCDILPSAKRHKGEEIVALVDEPTGNKNILLTLLSETDKPVKKVPNVIKKTNQVSSPMKKIASFIEEPKVMITFYQWLASVTERINQTMHYQFSGKPDPLVFHSPQCFFDCLQLRISSGFKKKRLPNSTTAFVRKDALPLGTFTKYSWQITNILHVKQIFDTKEMPLQITRSFVENRDGTYDLYIPPENDDTNSFRKTVNNPLIKPFELKTYLQVGNTSPDQKEATPFIIEWIPNILPSMKIGELRITFEYGHQRNGLRERRYSINDQQSQLVQVEEIIQ